MRRIVVLLLVVCLTSQMSVGQTNHFSKPFWTNGYFKELSNSYVEVVSAFDYNIDSARNKAANEILKRRSLATGSGAKVTIQGNSLNVNSEHDLIVKARIIDEYVSPMSNGYKVYLLVQTAKNPMYSYESVTLSNDYKVSGRAFVPGMAQIYKGSKAKGYTIIATQALSVASIILCENQRAAYHKKALEQPKFAKEYSNKASNWETGRNISIGVAAGIYLYNIIDAFVAKGKTHIVFKASETSLHFTPDVSPYSAGVCAVFNF